MFKYRVDHLGVRDRFRAATPLRRAERLQRSEPCARLDRLGSSFTLAVPALSGGRRLRVAIARALAAEPRIFLLDEPTSALDVSERAEILYRLTALRADHGLTYVMVSRDLAVLGHVCGRLAVMNDSRIVEVMDVQSLRARRAGHPCSQKLLRNSIGA